MLEIAIVVSLSIASLEIASRLLNLGPAVYRLNPGAAKSSYRVSDNPLLGYVLRENYRDTKADSHESFSYINAQGQRDAERTFEKPANTKRIVMIGDSVLLGNGIADLNDTNSRQLERKYQSQGTEVLTLGVGGYCTLSEVELLRVKALKFKPDVVVVLFVNNDYAIGGEIVGSELGARGLRPFYRPSAVEKLFLNSCFFRWVSMAFDLFHFRTELDPYYHLDSIVSAVSDNNVDRGFAMLKDLTKRNKFKVIVAIWPKFEERVVSDGSHPWDLRHPNQLLVESIAEKYGFPAIRLSPYFKVPKGGNPKELFSIGDGMHPSVLGAHIAAEALYDVLAK